MRFSEFYMIKFIGDAYDRFSWQITRCSPSSCHPKTDKTRSVKEIRGREKVFISYHGTIRTTPDKNCTLSNVFFLRYRVPILVGIDKQNGIVGSVMQLHSECKRSSDVEKLKRPRETTRRIERKKERLRHSVG